MAAHCNELHLNLTGIAVNLKKKLMPIMSVYVDLIIKGLIDKL